MSILEQVLNLGAQLSAEERQQVIDAWREDEAPFELDDATRQMLDAELARMARGEGQSIAWNEAMASLQMRRTQ